MQVSQFLSGVINNVALLLAMVLIYALFAKDAWLSQRPVLQKLILGAGLSVVGLSIMATPVVYGHGIIFDTRSILIAASGLFFGTLPTLVLVIVTAAYRIYLGGGGMVTGVSVIIVSAAIGLLWRHFYGKRLSQLSFVNMVAFGAVVHVAMLICFALFFPREVRWEVLRLVTGPIIMIYPFGLAMLCLLLRGRLISSERAVALAESEKRYRALSGELEVLNQALKQQAKEADNANQAKSQFLANMSHEMRTPLNGIVGMNYLLMDSSLNPLQKSYAKTIGDCSQILLDTINSLLDVAKTENANLELSPTFFAVDELFSAVAQIIEFRAHEKGLDLSFHIPDDAPPTILADFAILRQILLNLVNNAVKFTEQGSVRIDVRFEADSNNRAQAIFSVSDTGIGIDSRHFDQLFEKFYQVNDSHSRQHQGTGLGLAICRNWVRQLGGDISVQSTVGKGSTFTFSVPVQIPYNHQKSVERP